MGTRQAETAFAFVRDWRVRSAWCAYEYCCSMYSVRVLSIKSMPADRPWTTTRTPYESEENYRLSNAHQRIPCPNLGEHVPLQITRVPAVERPRWDPARTLNEPQKNKKNLKKKKKKKLH